MAQRTDIDEMGLRQLVDAFYARVRADKLIGPLFNGAIDDWPGHLTRLADFWSSVMLGSGRYKGQPVPAHARYRAQITPAMFDRWLALWAETTNALMTPEAAHMLQGKAARIAESLSLALFFKPSPSPTGRRPARSPGVSSCPCFPWRRSPPPIPRMPKTYASRPDFPVRPQRGACGRSHHNAPIWRISDGTHDVG